MCDVIRAVTYSCHHGLYTEWFTVDVVTPKPSTSLDVVTFWPPRSNDATRSPHEVNTSESPLRNLQVKSVLCKKTHAYNHTHRYSRAR